ncbi:hypothetical protein B0H14DRAFT_3620036 [Mycena olivaceomarginata]|nr:hypothetical protein B0H14DRAFT_3620036 [Mycena olivaceomarginata]
MHSFGVGILLGLLASSALASSPAATKVLTPGGYRLSTDVHEVPAGGRVAHVGNDVHLVGADGTVLHVVPNVTKAVENGGRTSPPQQSGWITYASWLNTSPSPISNFSTTYTVPAPPNTYHGQTVFLFNSIEPSSFDAILQPVLQYGPSTAGGGQYWSVATWYLYGPLVFYTPLVGSQYRATAERPHLVGRDNRQHLQLHRPIFEYPRHTDEDGQRGGADLGNRDVGGVRYITAASDYPPGSSTFYEINIEFAGPAPTVSWGVTNDEADGLFTTINRDGAFQGVLTITY